MDNHVQPWCALSTLSPLPAYYNLQLLPFRREMGLTSKLVKCTFPFLRRSLSSIHLLQSVNNRDFIQKRTLTLRRRLSTANTVKR
jgi:hypothetical protein